jgi:hypothetical protein
MKQFLFIICLSLFSFSCKKVLNENDKRPFIDNVKTSLRDSVSKSEYEALDFSKSLLWNVDSVNLHILRIPFKGKSLKDGFVLLQLNEDREIITGRLINIIEAPDNNLYTGKPFNGSIAISWLNGSTIIKSEVSNGYITAFHPSIGSLRSLVVPYEGHVLGEVVVVSYIHNESTPSYSFWINLSSLFAWSYESSGGGYSANYNFLDGWSSSGGGGGYYGGGGGLGGGGGSAGGVGESQLHEDPAEDPAIKIDFEPVENKDAIEVEKYLKCFANIPDAGSTCSIEILSDIPVDKDPNVFFNWNTGSPGHTFLQIKKSSGSEIVSQNIGFYPEEGWKTLLTTAPVKGKFVDNGYHEFNASLKRDISADQLKDVLIKIENLSKFVKYDIDEYNCTDFALEVFNSVPFSKPLEIPKFNIPGGMAPNGTNTPQGLYQKLKSMRQAGEEYTNITIPGVKGFVSSSNGPCN